MIIETPDFFTQNFISKFKIKNFILIFTQNTCITINGLVLKGMMRKLKNSKNSRVV